MSKLKLSIVRAIPVHGLYSIYLNIINVIVLCLKYLIIAWPPFFEIKDVKNSMPAIATKCSMGSSNKVAEDAAYYALYVERALTVATSLAGVLYPKVAVFSAIAGPAFALIQNILSSVKSSSEKDGLGLHCVETKIKSFMNEKEYNEWSARLEGYTASLNEIKKALIKIQPDELPDKNDQKAILAWLKNLGKSHKEDQKTIWKRLNDVIWDMKHNSGMYVCRNWSIPQAPV